MLECSQQPNSITREDVYFHYNTPTRSWHCTWRQFFTLSKPTLSYTFLFPRAKHNGFLSRPFNEC